MVLPDVCLWEDVGSPGTGSTDSGELPCGGWELNPGPPKEQSGLLNAELALQLVKTFLMQNYPVSYQTMFIREHPGLDLDIPREARGRWQGLQDVSNVSFWG